MRAVAKVATVRASPCESAAAPVMVSPENASTTPVGTTPQPFAVHAATARTSRVTVSPADAGRAPLSACAAARRTRVALSQGTLFADGAALRLPAYTTRT